MQVSAHETDSKRNHYSGKDFYVWWFCLIPVKNKWDAIYFHKMAFITCRVYLFGVGIYNDVKTDSWIFF